MLNLKAWMQKVSELLYKLDKPRSSSVISGSYPSNGQYSSNLPVGGYQTGTIITLQPNTRYLIIGQGADNSGGLTTAYSDMYVTSGSTTYLWTGANQPYGNAGNKHLFFTYVETANNNVGIGVNAYIYTASDRGYLWYLLAIPIAYYG